MKLFHIIVFGLTLGVIFMFLGGTKQSFSSNDLSTLPQSDIPVIVELFTSQGCSSCPPADRLAEALTQRNNLYILSCHVTYWDYIGWKDTLGSSACDDRQRQYAYTMKGSARVYTPQIIINGRTDMVGSRSGEVINEITKAQNQTTELISMRSNDDQSFQIDLPNLDASKRYKLRAFLIKTEEVTPIGRGENRNKTVIYVQNVKDIYNIGNWSGQSESRSVPIPPHLIRSSRADQIIILANQDGSGAVSAVGRLKL